jgi:hypothetical protein
MQSLLECRRRWLAKYGERMRHEHAWDVELTCPVCGTTALPIFHGWTPSNSIHGRTPTIYAELSCAPCGADLKVTAGRKLVELFANLPIPSRNLRVLFWFLAVTLGGPLLLTVGLFAGVWAGWWGYGAFLILTGLAGFTAPGILWLNWQVHSLRYRCDCGKPAYKFMGLVGRSYGYRCSTCGSLLRLRD